MRITKCLVAAAFATLALMVFGQTAGGEKRSTLGRHSLRLMGAGPASPYMLLTHEDVQAELALTNDQKARLKDVRREHFRETRERRRGDSDRDVKMRRVEMERMHAEVAEKTAPLFTSVQKKRLKEIRVQVSGYRIALDAEIAREIGITSEQKELFDNLMESLMQGYDDDWESVRRGELASYDVMSTGVKRLDLLEMEIVKLLAEGQRAKIEQMQGKPFRAKL